MQRIKILMETLVRGIFYFCVFYESLRDQIFGQNNKYRTKENNNSQEANKTYGYESTEPTGKWGNRLNMMITSPAIKSEFILGL